MSPEFLLTNVLPWIKNSSWGYSSGINSHSHQVTLLNVQYTMRTVNTEDSDFFREQSAVKAEPFPLVLSKNSTQQQAISCMLTVQGSSPRCLSLLLELGTWTGAECHRPPDMMKSFIREQQQKPWKYGQRLKMKAPETQAVPWGRNNWRRASLRARKKLLWV